MTDSPEVQAAPAATITPTDNGSYRVSGAFTVTDPEGNTFTTEAGRDVYLCRCGQSASKPFCDGSHKRVGFTAITRATEA